jgi:hypothetical protein
MLVPSTGKPAPRAFARRTVQLLAKSFLAAVSCEAKRKMNENRAAIDPFLYA